MKQCCRGLLIKWGIHLFTRHKRLPALVGCLTSGVPLPVSCRYTRLPALTTGTVDQSALSPEIEDPRDRMYKITHMYVNLV